MDNNRMPRHGFIEDGPALGFRRKKFKNALVPV